MKKIILSLIALFAMTTAVLAQDQAQNNQQRRQRMDPTQMIERRTQQMVETYKLSEEQAKQVKELNEKFFRNMGQRQRGENAGEQRPQRSENAGEQQRPRGANFMTEYNEELKKILTEEQYKAYQADAEKMRQNRGNRGGQRGGFGGQRRGQQNQN